MMSNFFSLCFKLNMPSVQDFFELNPVYYTVHFWAPTFKWGISIANIADFAKPPEKISYPQQIGMCSLWHWKSMG